jgi:hypothetical protein
MVMKLTCAGVGCFTPALRITQRLSYFIPIFILLNLSLLSPAFPQGQFRKDIFFPLKGYSIKDVGGKLHVMLLTSKGMQPLNPYPLWSPSSSGR